MVQYQLALRVLGAGESLDETAHRVAQERIASICEGNSNVDYSGLDEPIQAVVKDMVQLSRALLMASCSGGIEESPALEDYTEGAREHLQHAGLASWVACRCAMEVIQSVTSYGLSPSTRRRSVEKAILALAKDVFPFYKGGVPDESRHPEDESRALDSFLSMLRRSYMFPLNGAETTLPRYVRLKRGTEPIAVVDLLAASIHTGSDLPLAWMKTMPFSTEVIRPLVERCRGCLLDLLKFLGECSFVHIDRANPLLRVQDTRHILKIAGNTDDPKVLAGVAAALLSANFLRVTKAEPIQRLLQVALEVPLATMLFEDYRPQIEGRDSGAFGREIGTVGEVARAVLGTPGKYPFETVCQAANFLVEHQGVHFAPLLHEEKNLGIEC
jgi:hypothetical protein